MRSPISFPPWLCGVLLLTGVLGGASAEPVPTNRPPALTNSVPVLDPGESYQPSPQDKFQFYIEEDPNKGVEPETRNVSALYELRFNASRNTDTPIVINARGKTVADIKKELKEKLDADYYQNATVVLKLSERHLKPEKVFVTGAIRGQVPLLPGEAKTVMQAIVELGSDAEYANLKKVKLHRYNPSANKDDIYIIDVGAMLKGKSRKDDMILQGGDRIEVPEKGFIIN
jgi:protein involved in polysaccharide export with SLBB domain